MSKKLADMIPIQLTNSQDKHQWLEKIYQSAETDDGRAIVAALALLIDEVCKLQEQVGGLPEEIAREIK